MSRTANKESSEPDKDWASQRDRLFEMIMSGRSFSGRERNCLFLNRGEGRFVTGSAVSGIDFPDDGRCIAVTDWDGDGDVDCWLANRNAPRLRLMRNDISSDHHYVQLKLVGNGTTINRDAIGARVEVRTNRRTILKTVRAGHGFLSQQSKLLHFGLGADDQIEQVSVVWPDRQRTRQIWRDLAVDQRYELVQSDDRAQALSRRQECELSGVAERPLEILPSTEVARIVLMSRVPMPTIIGADSPHEDGSPSRVVSRFDQGRATWVTLFSRQCPICVEELKAAVAQRAALTEHEIDVIALSVDRLIARNQQKRRASLGSNEELALPEEWREVELTESEMGMLQGLHDAFFFPKKPLPLPTSFLVDSAGRVSVIYRGPVQIDQLIADSQLNPVDVHSAMEMAACRPGRSIRHPRVTEVLRRSDQQISYRIAAWLDEMGRWDDAIEHFVLLSKRFDRWAVPHRHLASLNLRKQNDREAFRHALTAIRLDPESGRAHNTLGLLLSRNGKERQAIQQFRKAVALEPDFAEAYNNLGTSLAASGDLDQAKKCFAQAIQLDSQFVEALTNLGSVYAAKDQLEEAIACYERAVKIDGTNADALNNLGTMYARQGDFRRAAEYYRQALKSDPHNRQVQMNLQRLERHQATRASGPVRDE